MSTRLRSSTSASTPVQRCTIQTLDGGYITEGIAVRIERPIETEARVTELREPGALLMAYVGRSVRRFRLTFGDGAIVEAELIGTTWQSSGRRLCRFMLDAAAESEPVFAGAEIISVVTASSVGGSE